MAVKLGEKYRYYVAHNVVQIQEMPDRLLVNWIVVDPEWDSLPDELQLLFKEAESHGFNYTSVNIGYTVVGRN